MLIIIMYASKIILSVMLLCVFNITEAQRKVKKDRLPRRKPSFVLQAGGGMSYYTGDVNLRSVATPGSLNKFSPAGTVRLMWYPRYRLRLGIESGFTNFYRYKVNDADGEGKLVLQAIPAMIVWNMQILPRLNIYAGFGSFFLSSHLNYRGKVVSKDVVLGSNIAISYTLPISKRVGIAAEGKFMNAFETKDAALTLQLHFVWKVFQWD
ncbi:MAG: hypothetical protein V4685_04450 [Bacteroidota bacterium]